jgi:hypothetical protein
MNLRQNKVIKDLNLITVIVYKVSLVHLELQAKPKHRRF